VEKAEGSRAAVLYRRQPDQAQADEGPSEDRQAAFEAVRTLPGRLRGLSVLPSKSALCGVFVWARRALNREKRRLPARAVAWTQSWRTTPV
jgi:hypothetical protein